jgi:hypothetical protein
MFPTANRDRWATKDLSTMTVAWNFWRGLSRLKKFIVEASHGI